MDNFEERFLEELAKAKARLEGKEAYDDEAIEKEFIPDESPIKTEPKVQKKTQNTKPETSEPVVVKTEKAAEVKTEAPAPEKKEKKQVKRKVNGEKGSVVLGAVAVVLSFVFSCMGLLINNDSPLWQAFDSYIPFAGIVMGAVSVIWGALLIKKNKKGTLPLVLGILAMFISVFVPAINF